MPSVRVRGAELHYDGYGSGDPVLLLPPAATRAAIWQAHQVPALVDAGWRVITLDCRGTPPSTVGGSIRLPDLVADVAEVIGELGLAPCRVVGASLGAMIAQELAAASPELVRAIALLGTRCRTDRFRSALACAHAAHLRSGRPTSELDALTQLISLFSARTLADDTAVADWLTLLRTFPVQGAGAAAQYEATVVPDRTAVLAAISAPCLVLGFSEDALTPPDLCREVADAIPAATYREIGGCGHFGFLENPGEVNATLTGFLSGTP